MRDPHLSCPVCRSTFQSVTPKCPRSAHPDEHEQDEGRYAEQTQAQLAVSLSSCTEVGDAFVVNATGETVNVLEEAPIPVTDVAPADTQRNSHQSTSALATTNTTQQAAQDISIPILAPQLINS